MSDDRIYDYYRWTDDLPLRHFIRTTPHHVDSDLMIGGPSDGERTRVLYGRHVIAQTPNGERATYEARKFAAGDTVFTLWVHSALTDAQAMELLLDGYRQPWPDEKDGAP